MSFIPVASESNRLRFGCHHDPDPTRVRVVAYHAGCRGLAGLEQTGTGRRDFERGSLDCVSVVAGVAERYSSGTAVQGR